MKRIAAIVLPELACELVQADGLLGSSANGSVETTPYSRGSVETTPYNRGSVETTPFACIVDDEPVAAEERDPNQQARARLDAVNPIAWRYGARPGQSAAEAAGFVGPLRIVHLSRKRIIRALETIAEIALGFGTTAAILLDDGASNEGFGVRYPLGAGAGPLDTVWLDVSGCAHLVGGEDLLAAELAERAKQLGHRARVSIAPGPRIARAVARWKPAARGRLDHLIVPPNEAEAARCLSELPIAALPFDTSLLTWLGKLGIFTVGDLARLDRKRLAHRLGPRAHDVLELIAGRDPVPIFPHQPPRTIVECAAFEDEICGTEPLTFVLRGLVARAQSRLEARGEACTAASLDLCFDRGVVALKNRQPDSDTAVEDSLHIPVELPIALSREDELMRALRAKLERLEIAAPILSVTLTLERLTTKPHHQLDVSRKRATDPHALPMLLAELSGWLGPDRVGVLSLVDSHRPERRSQLTPIDPRSLHGATKSAPPPSLAVDRVLIPEPTRILTEPVEVGVLQAGGLVGAPNGLYLIDHLRLSTRIDRVEWWTTSPVCRDYARAWLRTGMAGEHGGPVGLARRDPPELAEAWVFVDRKTKRGYLHGWFE